jgi:beta-lactamase class A
MLCRTLVCLLACSCLLAQAAQTPARVDERVKAKVGSFPGKVSLFAKNLETGQTYGLSPNDPVRTASTIKLAVMTEAFAQAEEGKLNWDELVKLTSQNKVSGSGVLTEFSNGVQLPVRDVMHLMIVVSDNTAANMMIDRVGGNAVNARMAQFGLVQTRLMRKIMSGGAGVTDEGAKPENKQWGIGRSSPAEMVEIVEKLYRGEWINKNASNEMLAVMKRQQYHDGIGRDLKDVTIASKSGALDHLRSDVGIVYLKNGPIAMAVTVDGIPEVNYTDDNPGNLLISALSEIILQKLATPPVRANPVSPE